LLAKLGHINEHKSVIAFRYRLSAPIARFVMKCGISPTQLNVFGLLAGLACGVCVACGLLQVAGVLWLVSALCDALDGFVARARAIESVFGEFFDSVCDRYVDTTVLLGIAWHFMSVNEPFFVLLTFFAVIGVGVTSYSRARAQSLGLEPGYTGFLNRLERVALLMVAFIFPASLHIVTWALAILSNATAVHRVIAYSSAARR